MNFKGYAEPAFEKFEIVQNTSEKTDEFSPAAKTIVTDLSKGKLFNAGISFVAYWKFSPDLNHDGGDFELKVGFEIIKKTIPFLDDQYYTMVDKKTYKEGANPGLVIPEASFDSPYLVLNDRYYELTYKFGSGPVTNGSKLTASEVASLLKKGDIFRAYWRFELDSNYRLDGTIRHSFYIIKHFEVI